MGRQETFLFYDLETSGLNPAFDQILQFAAIRTDFDLTVLEEHEFRVRLRPDVIPAPGALLATDVSVVQALTTGIREYDAVRQIHALVNQPGTTSIGYNSFAFDDLFLRFSFYRNLLPPYTHQHKNGCARLDILPIATWYWSENSDVVIWPTVDGLPTLKLEYLSQANRLATGQAHDALVDVKATVELTRRLRHDGARWQECVAFFGKHGHSDRLAALDTFVERPIALLVSHRFGYENGCQAPALHLGINATAGERHIWLPLDQEALRAPAPRDVIDGCTVIRQKPGEPPFMRNPEPNALDETRRALTRANLQRLRDNPSLLEALTRRFCEETHATDVTPDLDAALYANGFPDRQTEDQCHRFHALPLSEKLLQAEAFHDETARERAGRLLSRNYGLGHLFPSYAAFEAQIQRGDPPLRDYRGHPRLTPAAALAAIDTHRQNDLTARQHAILDDLSRYIWYHFGNGDAD